MRRCHHPPEAETKTTAANLRIEPCPLPDPPCDVLQVAMPLEAIGPRRFARQVLLDPNFRAEGSLLARVDGKPAGYALAIARQMPLENAAPDPECGYLTLFGVKPGYRNRGIGTALLERAEAFLRKQGRSEVLISSYAPGYFIPGVDVEGYAGGLGFHLKRGYREQRRALAMEAPLWSLDVPEWVEGKRSALASASPPVRCVPYNRGLTMPLLEFTRRCLPGDCVRVVRETMAAILSGHNPNRLILAVQPIAHLEARVVGFSHYDNERFGPIGVEEAERGRGIGHVLMYETFKAQREAGLRTTWFLWSDDETAARLYEGAGFKAVRRFSILSKKL